MTLDAAVTIDEDVRHFVRWALATLGVSVAGPGGDGPGGDGPGGDGASFDVPAGCGSVFQGANVVQLVYGGDSTSLPGLRRADDSNHLAAGEPTLVTVDDQFLTRLMGQLNAAAKVPYAVPRLPPVRVHEISAQLFKAYAVDGGTMHLSGCTLEDRPLLRQTWLVSGDSEPVRLVHRFADSRGVSLPEAEVAALGLNSLRPPAGPPLPPLSQADVQAWCAAARRHWTTTGDAIPDGAATVASVVWCQYAAGKVEFVIDDVSTEVAFAGWARQLASGQIAPPAFQCPVTGIQSHAIAATDDGRVTAREAIKVCAASGRRVLVSELGECEQTGQTVLPEYLVTCPVSGRRMLESAMRPCGTCRQSVSPACLENGLCQVCRSLVPIRKDDPRMARVLGEYPRLDRWRNWRIGETSTSYVLVAAALIKRLLVVVNKESLEIARLATRNRFSSHWMEPPLADRQEFLGE